jgi:hypothetical protein
MKLKRKKTPLFPKNCYNCFRMQKPAAHFRSKKPIPDCPGGIFASAGFTLIQMGIALMLIGLLAGSAFMAKELVTLYRIHAQVSQIATFDEAVENFQTKYGGLPGDLLSISAERQGLPAGNGTPGHSDGDGNISPCNLGWQWHLGCETALFWSHLSISGMISENFSADSRFVDSRLPYVGSMDPYLPKLALTDDVYIAVWNSNPSQPSPKPQIPYGNYYELSGIKGVLDEKMVDDSRALTPLQSYAIDKKIDDGFPLSGRVVANGEANWPKDAWGTYAKPGISNCVYTDKTYNTNYFLRAEAPLCHLAIRLGTTRTQKSE